MLEAVVIEKQREKEKKKMNKLFTKITELYAHFLFKFGRKNYYFTKKKIVRFFLLLLQNLSLLVSCCCFFYNARNKIKKNETEKKLVNVYPA